MKNRYLLDIKLAAFDVDGIFSNDKFFYTDKGLALRSYSAKDGTGIYMLIKAGLNVALISSSKRKDIKIRAKDIGIKYVYLGAEDKGIIIKKLCHELKIKKQNILFMGDDIWDIPAFIESGIAVTVPEAPIVVKKYANWITKNNGGNGAIREVADRILVVNGINPLRMLGLREYDN